MVPSPEKCSLKAVLICLLAVVSCSRPENFTQFQESAGDGSRYDFDVPFTRSDAEYGTFVAFNLVSTWSQFDSIPAQIAVVSPSGRMAVETVSFPLRGMKFSGNAVEYPYRSGIRVARDTGLWHLSIILQDSSQYSAILGAGFRYELTNYKK